MWTGTAFEIDIYFIRHGKTLSNELKRYISVTDEDLCEAGREQIIRSKDKYPVADMVFVSSRKRTWETASLIYSNLPQTTIPEFDEINFGKFEGKTYEELKSDDDYCAWLASGCAQMIPGGESRSEFIERQLRGLYKLLGLAKDIRQAVVVGHGGTIMSLFSHFTDMDYFDLQLSNADSMNCKIIYDLTESGEIVISSFSITDRNNT